MIGHRNFQLRFYCKHEIIIRTGITSKKYPVIFAPQLVGNVLLKIQKQIKIMLNIYKIQVRNRESKLVYASMFSLSSQLYFLIEIINQS